MINEKKVLMRLAGAVMMFAVLSVSAGAADSESVMGRMNLGLNYPGFSFRYGLADNIAAEFKVQATDDVYVLGPRVYYFLGKLPVGINLYMGLESAVIFFKGEDSKGEGLAQIIFAGGEYHISPSLSISGDIGPGLIMLSDSGTSQSAFSTSIIAHVSINYFLK